MHPTVLLGPLLPPDFGDQLQATLVTIVTGLVLFAIAILVAFVGWLVALGLSRAARALFAMLGIDGPVARLQHADRGRSVILPSHMAGYIVFWSAFLASCILALRVMGLDLMPAITERLEDVVPRVLTSILVLIAGVPIAVAAARFLNSMSPQASPRSTRIRHQVYSSVLVGIVVLLALDQLGIAAQLVVGLGITAVAAVGLGLALAFGLGCRDLVRDLIVEYLRASETDAGADRA